MAPLFMHVDCKGCARAAVAHVCTLAQQVMTAEEWLYFPLIQVGEDSRKSVEALQKPRCGD